MTRDEAENMDKHPEGYECLQCDDPQIECFGMEDENSVRFGCHSCGYVWYEEVEDEDDDDDY